MKPFQCGLCSRRFKSAESSLQHINAVHSKDKIFKSEGAEALVWWDGWDDEPKMDFATAVDLVPDDLPDGAFWAMAHELAGIEYGEGFAELQSLEEE